MDKLTQDQIDIIKETLSLALKDLNKHAYIQVQEDYVYERIKQLNEILTVLNN